MQGTASYQTRRTSQPRSKVINFMDSVDQVFAVTNNETKSILYIGSKANCEIKAKQLNVLVGYEKFVILPHKTNEYVANLISRQNSSLAFREKKETGKIYTRLKNDAPPKLIPETSIKQRIQDYLKNLKK